MTPRKASLRVAHQRSCAFASRTAIESATKGSGCSCKPSYYVLWRDRSGATRKSSRVHDKRTAERMLNEQQVEIDRGNVGYQERRDLEFPAWLDEYDAFLTRRKVKEETRRGYNKTLAIAKDAFGHLPVRAIGQAEMGRFYKKIEHTKPATVARYLRELGACLQAAMIEGYADRNPVPQFRKSLNLKVPKTSSPPFTDAELAKLYAGLADADAVYLAIVKAAAETGCRIGELVAADWPALKLLEGELRVTGTWNSEDGLTTPKDGEARTVYLTPAAKAVFEEWAGRHEPDASGPLFASPTSGGRLYVDYARRLVRDAMTDGGIPTVDPISGLRRKPFHSLRATFTRRQLEAGRHPRWVEAQLGHSSLDLTIGVYGSWSRDAMVAEAAKE